MKPSHRWLAVLGLTWVWSAAPTAARQKGPCGCSDVQHLQARFCMAAAAVGEWDRLIEWMKQREAKTQQVEMLNEGKRGEVKDCVNWLLSVHRQSFHGTGPATSPIPTPEVDANTDSACKVTINAPTACLRDVLQRHEAEHEKICRAMKDPSWDKNADLDFLRRFFATFINWRYSQSLVSYMLEERHSYAHEMTDLEKRLKELYDSGKCPGLFEFTNPDNTRKFSLTPCPRPDLDTWKGRKCKLM